MDNALLIPIHGKKFNWLYLFLLSIPDYEIDDLDFDIVLLVSNEKEKIQISRAISCSLPQFKDNILFFDVYQFIESSLQHEKLLYRYINNIDRCIVNLKKFCAIYWAKKYYKNIAVIDCDSAFNKTTKGFFDCLFKNYQTRYYFGSSIESNELCNNVLNHCAGFFNENLRENISQLTNGFKCYPWFFDVPFYHVDDLNEFYDYFNSSEFDGDFWMAIEWESFEHIIYIYYLCLFKDASILDYSNCVRSVIPETLLLTELNKIYYRYNYYPVWIRFRNVLNNPENVLTNQPKMFYHIDRL
ncbi:hypothetical protein GCM10023206_18850 [Acinetobacter puyangensis]|uniref:Uncharacterized protein n=1 Tax=Acinetobacter puyangensis TaxID=1096779 RepID=A0A240E6H9_9GAMM|nr:hypothetical protein [Acinetobacter puyangensis]SNX43853.1 hypothetical protein SAMN05421731_1029 [Acinetobacter puyangensis]